MKIKITNIIILLLVIYSTSANAQIKEVPSSPKFIEIGKIGGYGWFVSSLKYIESKDTKGQNHYLWQYNNENNNPINIKTGTSNLIDIKGISFDASSDEINLLYESMKKQMNAENISEKKFELGNITIVIVTRRSWLSTSLVVFEVTPDGGFFTIQSNQLDKLFGKKKK
jgi:hypothetical protein